MSRIVSRTGQTFKLSAHNERFEREAGAAADGESFFHLIGERKTLYHIYRKL